MNDESGDASDLEFLAERYINARVSSIEIALTSVCDAYELSSVSRFFFPILYELVRRGPGSAVRSQKY